MHFLPLFFLRDSNFQLSLGGQGGDEPGRERWTKPCKAGVVSCVCPVGSWPLCTSLLMLTVKILSENQEKMLFSTFLKKKLEDRLLHWRKIVFIMI